MTPYDKSARIYTIFSGQVTKMAAMLIYAINLLESKKMILRWS